MLHRYQDYYILRLKNIRCEINLIKIEIKRKNSLARYENDIKAATINIVKFIIN